jgi:glycine/D-amino acid oxidase-like deaminating enzyme
MQHSASLWLRFRVFLGLQFHDRILPTQTQAASGDGGPTAMQPHVGISGTRGFFGKHGDKVMVGSDATRVPDLEAGRIQPSRFITKFLLGELRRYFGPSRYHITHEWSGTVSYTPDEYPIVGRMDGHRQYIIGGMAGSGTGVSFNAARCIVNRILGLTDEPDDYPPEYFAPTRLLDPRRHTWPTLEK